MGTGTSITRAIGCALLLVVAGASPSPRASSAAFASVSVAVAPAADAMTPPEPLQVFVTVKNELQQAISDVECGIVGPDQFVVERVPPERRTRVLPAGGSSVEPITIRPQGTPRPGTYTMVATVDYRPAGKEGAVRETKSFTFDVHGLAPKGLESPGVTVTLRASGDTLRENTHPGLDLYLFVANRSGLSLEDVEIEIFAPPAISFERIDHGERPKAVPVVSLGTLPPFGTRMERWTINLDTHDRAGLKYGKQTIVFDTTYGWQWGAQRYRSHSVDTLDVSTTFFGADGFTQVFGVPLNLIVFVLPGFCLLWTYSVLKSRLLPELEKPGEEFTPTKTDALFYSVVWSVFLIFAFRWAFGKDLYAFFSSSDLFLVNLFGAAVGAVVPGWRWHAKRRRDAAEAKAKKARAALEFTPDDDALTMLRKAFALHPDGVEYTEVNVQAGGVVWSGILLQTSAAGVVLGAQIAVSAAATAVAEKVETALAQSPVDVGALSNLLAEHAEAKDIRLRAIRPVIRGQEQMSGVVQILPEARVTNEKGVIPLVEVEYR